MGLMEHALRVKGGKNKGGDMEKKPIELSIPEAALGLTVLISAADDNPSEEEGVVLRKYYKYETGESLEKKLEEAGFLYPKELSAAEPLFVETIKKADRNFQLRTMAVTLLVAKADGNIDREELLLLNRFCSEFNLSIADAEKYSNESLKEIDETSGYHDADDEFDDPLQIHFSPEEAGIALASLLAFSDDDPSEAEVGVIREYYPYDAAENMIRKMKEADFVYPDELAKTEPAIKEALRGLPREDLLFHLAVVYKTAAADGSMAPEEEAVLKGLCTEFVVGLSELKEYFKTVYA